MALLSSQQLKVFVPARDYAVSQRFYRALGFVQEDEVGNVTCFRHGTHCAFLLQDFYLRELAENLMLHLWVDDADSWWQHVHDTGLGAQFGVSCSAPEDRPWAHAISPCTIPAACSGASGIHCRRESGIVNGELQRRAWCVLQPIPDSRISIPRPQAIALNGSLAALLCHA